MPRQEIFIIIRNYCHRQALRGSPLHKRAQLFIIRNTLLFVMPLHTPLIVPYNNNIWSSRAFISYALLATFIRDTAASDRDHLLLIGTLAFHHYIHAFGIFCTCRSATAAASNNNNNIQRTNANFSENREFFLCHENGVFGYSIRYAEMIHAFRVILYLSCNIQHKE